MPTFSPAVAGLGFAFAALGFTQAAQAAAPGTPRTALFQVNQSAFSNRYLDPSVGSDDSGNLVVAWAANGRVWVRCFGSDGSPHTGEMAVSTAVTPALAPLTNVLSVADVLGERTPAVAVNRSTGDFIVAWVVDGGDAPLGFGLSPIALYDQVLVRHFDRTGQPKGLPVVVTSTQTRTPWELLVSMNRSGAFVAAWQDTDRATDRTFAINLAWYNSNDQQLGTAQPPVQNVAAPFLVDAGISGDGHVMAAWGSSNVDGTVMFGDCYTPQGTATGAVSLPAGIIGHSEDGNILVLTSGTGGLYQRSYDAGCRQVTGDVLLPGSAALSSASRLAIDSVHDQLAVFGWQYQLLADGFYHFTGYLGLYSLSGTAYGAVQPMTDVTNTDNYSGADSPHMAFGGPGNLWAAWNWSPDDQTSSIMARGYYGGVTAQAAAHR